MIIYLPNPVPFSKYATRTVLLSNILFSQIIFPLKKYMVIQKRK